MLSLRVDLQLAPHRFAKLRLGQHAAHGFFEEPDGVLLADVLRPLLPQAPLVAAVIAVKLLVFLAAGETHARRVDDHDVITRIQVGRVRRLVLSLEEASGLRRDSADDLAVGINHMPLPDNCPGGGNKRTHELPFGRPHSKDGKPRGYRRFLGLSRRAEVGSIESREQDARFFTSRLVKTLQFWRSSPPSLPRSTAVLPSKLRKSAGFSSAHGRGTQLAPLLSR